MALTARRRPEQRAMSRPALITEQAYPDSMDRTR
jgi:hypothetical protein